MKIVHIASHAPYNDYWGYQDNLLPKYQRKDGHDVTLIITTYSHKDGKIVEVGPADYVLKDGVRVIRLKKRKYFHRVLTNLNAKMEVYPHLQEICPDFIFVHGLNGTTIYDVIKYKKNINPACIIVRDNHLDYNNCPAKGIKRVLQQVFESYTVKKTMPYIERVYGVTPWRKKFAEDYFRVPSSKTDVLIMGADDDSVDIPQKARIRTEVREENGISNQDFLIVTGGKIDRAKNVHLLMEACTKISGVKLLVFGNVGEDVKEEFEGLLSADNQIIYVGWIDSAEVYRYFFAADLIIFPGGHSVLWEQACASKVPCVFRKWEGMEHLNNGGNSDFFNGISSEEMINKIKSLQFTPKYYAMKQVAESEATDVYLYSRIAEKSIECAKINECKKNF